MSVVLEAGPRRRHPGIEAVSRVARDHKRNEGGRKQTDGHEPFHEMQEVRGSLRNFAVRDTLLGEDLHHVVRVGMAPNQAAPKATVKEGSSREARALQPEPVPHAFRVKRGRGWIVGGVAGIDNAAHAFVMTTCRAAGRGGCIHGV